MKWLLVAGFLVAVARFGNAGALKCSPTSLRPTCLEENGEVSQEAVSPERETEYSEEECLPGSEWESNCHSCLCSSRGVALCSKLSKCEQEGELKPLPCKPGTTYKRDCNTCICPEDGVSLCTEIGCLHNLHTSENITKNGMEELDHLEMVPEYQHNRIKRTVCKPGQEFQSECNICHCATDGLSYRCTQNECMEGKEEEGRVDKEVEVFMESEGVDHIERHSVCRALATFYIGCNTCHCNYDGTDYTCTNKPCPLPDDVELFHELRALPDLKSAAVQPKNKTVVCVANRMFIKDCNTCWCNEDGTGFFCTRKVCVHDLPEDAADEEKPEELRVIQRDCRPDEVFEVDCNMCRCNPDGKSFSCTRRACLAETPVENDQVVFEEQKPLSRMVRGVSTQQEAPKMCQPGQEFRVDCNKCLCDNEGKQYSCTRIDCRLNNGNGARRKREVAQQAVTQCDPGAVFDQGCNVCRCADDGHHANCTLKRCSLKPDAKEDNNMPAADTGFRCNPGEQFKRGCSDCTCSADGKSDFCTLRVCDKDLIPRL